MSTSSSHFDVICIGAGPTGLACAIEAKRAGLRPLVIDKGCLCNSLYHYPTNMLFFTTPERMEIGDLPMTTLGGKPTRLEALKYYRRAVDHYALETRLYERVDRIHGHDGAFAVHTTTALPTDGSREAGNFSSEDAGVEAGAFRPPNRTSSEGGASASGNPVAHHHEYHSRKIIIATGYYDLPNHLCVPGEDLPFVSHYFTDPHPYWNEHVVVIGAKNSAAEAALELFRAGARVTLVHRGPTVGKSLKYWVKPDIENRIRAGEIKALFNTCVTRFSPGRVFVTSTLRAWSLTTAKEDASSSLGGQSITSGSEDASRSLGGRSFSSDITAAQNSGALAPEVEAGAFRPPNRASTNEGALAPGSESTLTGEFQTRPTPGASAREVEAGAFRPPDRASTNEGALAPGSESASDHTARDGEQILHAVQVFALTGYHPDYDFLRRQGIRLNPETLRPAGDPDTHETNVPGMYVAGVVVGGRRTSDIFIENGRFHGREIIAAITGKGRLNEPEPVAPPGE